MDTHQIFMGIIGVYLQMGLPWQMWRDRRAYIRRTGRVDGKVVGYKYRHRRHSKQRGFYGHMQVPQVQYEVDSITYICDAGSSANWKVYPLGKRLSVAYDPEEPSNAHTIHAWSHPLFFVIGMALSAVAGLVLIILALLL